MRSGYDQMAILQLAAQRGTPAFAASPFVPPNFGATNVGQLESPEMALLRQRFPWLFDTPAAYAAYYGNDPYVLYPAPAWYLPYPYPYFPGWGWGGWGGRRFHGGHHGGHHGHHQP